MRESDVSRPVLLQLLAQLAVELGRGAREMPRPESRQAWPFTPPPATCRKDVELLTGFGHQQRPPHLSAQRVGAEEVVELSVVDGDGPGSGTEKHAGG
jgi:hypothetical protein